MFQRYGKKRKDKDDEVKKKHQNGGPYGGPFEESRQKYPKQSRHVVGKFFQKKFDNDSDDEKMDKYDSTIADNADEEFSTPILSRKDGKAQKQKDKESEKDKRKKVIAIIIKKGMRNRNM